jgi:hypothetical protein
MSERDALTENVVRYGAAAFLCFSFAVLVYVAVVTGHLRPAIVENLAALGVAWWLVGCGLVPLTAYWAWRRAQLDSSAD